MPFYNPHSHVKIWISLNPNTFLNPENQVRLIKMRESNPDDKIHVIYDSKLLNKKGKKDKDDFCNEYNIIPIDTRSDNFKKALQSKEEQELYKFYLDEINHLDKGGNPAVASDILRWLPPVYQLGTYSDFDFPVNTNNLPEEIPIEAPIIMNIGSLSIQNKCFVLLNNDYIAYINEDAKDMIVKIQQALIKNLKKYDNNFIEKTKKQISSDGNSILLRFFDYIKKCSRAESIYIEKSKDINPNRLTSRELRQIIKEKMSDNDSYIEFNKQNSESTADTIIRLRKDLNEQLGFIKWLFFNNEYREIKAVLKQSDDALIEYLRKRELNLFIKAIVICTTGPLAISDALFDGYVIDKAKFQKEIINYSFHKYNLNKAFQSNNSIPPNINLIQMLYFLGANEGDLNDSSWLDSGKHLQGIREKTLYEKKQQFVTSLSKNLDNFRVNIEKRINYLKSKNMTGFFKYFDFFKQRREAKINALTKALECFDCDGNFNTTAFKEVFANEQKNKLTFKGIFSTNTKNLFEEGMHLSYLARIYRLTKNQTISKDTFNPNNSNKDTHIEDPNLEDSDIEPIKEDAINGDAINIDSIPFSLAQKSLFANLNKQQQSTESSLYQTIKLTQSNET